MVKKFTILSTVLTLFAGSMSYSQDDITDFLNFGQHNASQLIKSYVEPLGHSLGNNMNSGWYNTGQAHRLGRFDLRFAVPVTFIGDNKRYFEFDPDDYIRMSLVDPEDNQAPTLFGDDEYGPLVFFEGNENLEEGRFRLPPGTGIGYFPLVPPVLQLNVGLVRDTEVKIRYMPTVSVRDFSAGSYGFGIKHGVKQYIPVIEHLPVDISLIGSYTNMSTTYGLHFDPGDNPDIDIDEQELDISANAYSASLVASRRLPFITVYGGVRYMYADTQFILAGDYEIGTDNIITNPVDESIKSSQAGLNAGARLKLGILSIFVDGTWASYSSVTGGISMGFHN